MKYRVHRSEDADEARELHKLSFPKDAWVGDDHEYWFAADERGDVAAFASAIFYPDSRIVYLSRCGVLGSASGAGLQRRLIQVRTNWARRAGAEVAFTYTTIKNYPSIVNLLRCEYRFFKPDSKLGRWRKFHCMYRDLRGLPTPPETIKKLGEKIVELSE